MRLLTWFGALLTLLAACEGPAGPPGPQGPPGKDGTRPAPIAGAAGAPANACVNGQMSVPGGVNDPCSQDNAQCVALKGRGVAICSGVIWGQCVCMAPKPASSPAATDTGSVGYQPMFTVSCAAAVDVASAGDGLKETGLHYVVTGYSNRDVAVSCMASAGNAQSGSSSTYYPSPANGAGTGWCVAICDLPPFPVMHGEVGHWDFMIQAGGPASQYNDVDPNHPLNGFMYRFTESDCTTYARKGVDAEWTTAALSDVFD